MTAFPAEIRRALRAIGVYSTLPQNANVIHDVEHPTTRLLSFSFLFIFASDRHEHLAAFLFFRRTESHECGHCVASDAGSGAARPAKRCSVSTHARKWCPFVSCSLPSRFPVFCTITQRFGQRRPGCCCLNKFLGDYPQKKSRLEENIKRTMSVSINSETKTKQNCPYMLESSDIDSQQTRL